MSNRFLSFKGNHKEIGKQVGKQYKLWGKKEVYISPIADECFNSQLNLYQRIFPSYIEYLEGISEGLGISKDKVLKSYLTGFLQSKKKPKNECSTLVINNVNRVLVGRNYDWRTASEKVSALLEYNFTDYSSFSFTAITDMATWKFGEQIKPYQFVIITEDAWNEKGLYVSSNGTPGNKFYLGMCIPHLTQCIAEQCGTVDEAIELIKNVPTTESKIYTLADKNGNMAVVEKCMEKGTYVRTSKDYIFTTNHYNSTELLLENLSIFKNVPFHSTFGRYQYLQYSLLKISNSINLKQIIELLTKSPAAQNWRGPEGGDTVTVWTSALNLSTGKYLVEFAPLLKTGEVIQN